MMKRNLAICCLLALAGVAHGWVVSCRNVGSSKHETLASSSSSSSSSRRTRKTALGSSSSDIDNARDMYVVSWEGCLVNTVQWRTEQGLGICRQVWPDLEVLLSDDDEWLYNKVRDLHHVLVLDPQYSPSVEYALLIRLLLEEQELDQGRSNGSRGKYGSKYHPSANSDAFSNDEPSFNKRQQRPLTVGEIAANWQDSLREAVIIKYYREEGKNPLDMLQQALADHHDKSTGLFALHHSEDLDVLREHCNSIVVMAPHKSDLHAVQASLDLVNHVVCEDTEQALSVPKGTLPVICRTKQSVRQILQNLPCDSSLSVLESSWPILQNIVPVFGDCVPRQTNRPQPCSISNRNLQLALWRNSHPNDQAAALMNAWMHLREESQWPQALQPVTSSRRL